MVRTAPGVAGVEPGIGDGLTPGVTGVGIGAGVTPGVTGAVPGSGVGVTPGVTLLGVTPGMGVGVVFGYGTGLGVTWGGNGFTWPGRGFLTSPGKVSVLALAYCLPTFISGFAAIAPKPNMADTASVVAIALIFFIIISFCLINLT